jgi:hypothetical protein
MTTDLTRFTQWARESPQRQYSALMGMLYDPEGLNASFERLAANKAPGVDGMPKAEYADGSAERLADLSVSVRARNLAPLRCVSSESSLASNCAAAIRQCGSRVGWAAFRERL